MVTGGWEELVIWERAFLAKVEFLLRNGVNLRSVLKLGNRGC